MSLATLETIDGPNGAAEIFEYEPDGIDQALGGIGPNKYMLRFNGDLVGHYDDLHEARSQANELTGNMEDIDGIQDVLRVLESHWQDIHADFDRHNNRFLQLAQTDHDTIGRVLRAHLVVENFLDTFLATHYGIGDLLELKLSFFQKAKLLPSERSSAALVRPGILQLNAVRNKFGHRLNHQIERREISAIIETLAVARKGVQFPAPVTAIEAFTPVACAFLSVPPPQLQQLFADAFANVHSSLHEA